MRFDHKISKSVGKKSEVKISYEQSCILTFSMLLVAILIWVKILDLISTKEGAKSTLLPLHKN